jgi:hypothetical protein
MGVSRKARWLAAAVLLQSWGGAALAEPVTQAQGVEAAVSGDILAKLQSIPGVTVLEERRSPFPGTRFFRLLVEQPADHAKPQGERFGMRVNLLHRSESAPMVLAGGGYGLGNNPSRAEPTALLGANQLTVEHRFFGNSRPASNDWSLLDIRQAAGDYHRIVQLFKPLYSARWLNTGGSKGGMAAVYHRYFYPDDVDVSLPYVAPNTHGLNDVSYEHFVEQVGDADCRARLQDFQQDVLRRREELLPFMYTLGSTFSVIGGEDRALEFAVVETSYYFWQYGNASFCAFIPAPGAPAEETFGFLDGVVGIGFTYGDADLDAFAAYYYQAATEIGWTRFSTNHLKGLLRYPGGDVPTSYLSIPVPKPFDQDLMLRVGHWVRNSGERMLFIYGGNDPWSARPFEVRERNDSYRFFVPGGNHSARITQLPAAERDLALRKLFEWMGVSVPATGAALAPVPTLEAEDIGEEPAPRFRL